MCGHPRSIRSGYKTTTHRDGAEIAALICITPIDRSVSTGYELLLHIGSIYKELGHGSAITISGDSANGDFATNHKFYEEVTCFFRRDRVSALTP